ncbi:MAG: NADH-quinone oxidoreductase subunit N [Verrucomicrobiae bacterium]|nr:NADH-quinone oxidoreductase subunit N [Verrucomicrobiae bacterium]
MNLSDLLPLLRFLAPEILLSALALGALLGEAALSRLLGVEKRQNLLGWLALLGLGACLVILGDQAARGETLALGRGAFVASPFNALLKTAATLAVMASVTMGLRAPFVRHVGENYALVLFSLLGMFFLLSAESLLMIFVALELTSLPLYALAASQKGARRSIEGGLKYLLFGGLSAAFLLFGISYVYGMSGQGSLAGLRDWLVAQRTAGGPGFLFLTGVCLMIVGLGFKIAAAPFHLWAPDAYEGAPLPAAAILASASKLAGIVVAARLLLGAFLPVAGNVLGSPLSWHAGWSPAVAALAVASLTVGNLAALAQRNAKRFMAYSSVAHAGNVLVAFLALDASGRPAALAAPAIAYYAVIYALTNAGVFAAIHALAWGARGDDFADFRGAARRAPFPAFFLLIFLLSLAGVPPMAGFFGKLFLFMAALQADATHWGLAWLVAYALAMNVVALGYYLRFARVLWVEPAEDLRPISTPLELRVALVALALLVLGLGVFPSSCLAAFRTMGGVLLLRG